MKKIKNVFIILTIIISMVGCGRSEATQSIDSTKAETEVEETTGVELEETESEEEEYIVIKPQEATIETGRDYETLEILSEGRYIVAGTSIKIEVDYSIATIIDEYLNTEYIYDPVLIMTGDDIYLYGNDGLKESLDRVQILESSFLEKEKDVVWKHLPPSVNKCPGYFQGIYTFGESQNEDGTWRYALYQEGAELTGINVDKRLIFDYCEGIAVDEDGKVFMLYFSNNPYTIQIYEVDLPYKVNVNEKLIDIDYRLESTIGFGLVFTEKDAFIIKTEEKEALLRNSFRNFDQTLEPLKEAPTYTVVTWETENFDYFETCIGGQFNSSFDADCYMRYDSEYSFKVNRKLYEPENYWIGIFISDEELNQVWNKTYFSYNELEKAVEELKVFLDNWEKDNREEIIKKINGNKEFWISKYPEIAQHYGIKIEE